ncbi:MAG: hypothetical protein ABIG96_01120, partial [Candidatus Micrarchaeota archaeon]
MDFSGFKNKHAQTTFEYLFLAVGVIIFLVLIYTLLQGGVVGKQTAGIEAGLADFLQIGEYFLFYDNFDSGSEGQWTKLHDSWANENKEYIQPDLTDIEKTSYAGSMGWENYYADSKISFSSLPASAPALLGGISARVNKNTG